MAGPWLFEKLTVLSLIDDEPLDWAGAEAHIGELAFGKGKTKRLHADLEFLRDALEVRGDFKLSASRRDYPKGPFFRLNEGNLVLLILAIPDAVVNADIVELDRAIRRLERVGVLGATNLFLATPFKGRLESRG